MAEHILRTIEDLEAKLRNIEKEASAIKRTINDLSALAGRDPVYFDISDRPGDAAKIRNDQFYGKGTFTAIREYLHIRKLTHLGPASVNDIYDALLKGGFKFDAKDEDNAKRGIRISLTKNTGIFHRLPNGLFGLLEWYPNAKQPKKADEEDEEDLQGGTGAEAGEPEKP